MLGTAIAAPLPILFVFALGYAAGRAKQFNAAQSLGASRPVELAVEVSIETTCSEPRILWKGFISKIITNTTSSCDRYRL